MSLDVYHLNPINKTAAIVTGQSGCASDDTLTLEQQRQNLVAVKNALAEKALRLPRKSKERKAINEKVEEYNRQIRAIRPARQAKGVQDFFIDVCREEMTKTQFSIILGKASKRFDAKMAEIAAKQEDEL
jgi:hypothetical protein